MKLPNLVGDSLSAIAAAAACAGAGGQQLNPAVLRRQDLLLHFPYQSFDYLLRFLMQAVRSEGARDQGDPIPCG